MVDQDIRNHLESRQVQLYFGAVAIATAVALLVPGTTALEAAINPALAFMLFVTFLQVPLTELGRAFGRVRFTLPLLLSNFVAIPLLVGILFQVMPSDPLLRLGVLLVLLTPCVDYVVTFAHLGRADAKLLLAATPVLLLLQIPLLPLYLGLFLGREAAAVVQIGPFLHSFLWLIVVPLALAAFVQLWAGRAARGAKIAAALGILPVPATALVLFAVVAAVVPQLEQALGAVLVVVPIYIAFGLLAPFVGWGVARLFRLEAAEARSVAFSSATRNSLVVLPLALAVPGAVPVLPAIIVTQTLVELIFELVYIRAIPRLGNAIATQN